MELRSSDHLHLLGGRDVKDVESGSIFNGHRKGFRRGTDAGLAAADPGMLAERDVISELFLGGLQISLDDHLVLAVDKNRLLMNPEQIGKSLTIIHEHIPGGGSHKDLDTAELPAETFGKIFPNSRGVAVGGPEVESVIGPGPPGGAVQFVLKRIRTGGRGCGVRHVDEGCDPSEQCGLGLAFDVGLAFHSWFAEMHVGVYSSGHQHLTLQINDLGVRESL